MPHLKEQSRVGGECLPCNTYQCFYLHVLGNLHMFSVPSHAPISPAADSLSSCCMNELVRSPALRPCSFYCLLCWLMHVSLAIDMAMWRPHAVEGRLWEGRGGGCMKGKANPHPQHPSHCLSLVLCSAPFLPSSCSHTFGAKQEPCLSRHNLNFFFLLDTFMPRVIRLPWEESHCVIVVVVNVDVLIHRSNSKLFILDVGK